MAFTKLLKKITTGSSKRKPLALIKNKNTAGITVDLKRISVTHKGRPFVIRREKNPTATIPSLYNKTSRPCPPFCIQPMTIAPNVETIGELELIDYLTQSNGDSVTVVDSRIQSWVEKGTIPGSVHIPWTDLVTDQNSSIIKFQLTLKDEFSVKTSADHDNNEIRKKLINGDATNLFDFSAAKVLVFFCNGSWCGQSSKSIDALLKIGYPPEKLKYYREGMQGWVSLGLSIVIDDKACKLNAVPEACKG